MVKQITLAALTAFLGLALTGKVCAQIHSEVVNYEIAGHPFQGYISYDDAITGRRPGILVVHEWWGHNAYVRKRADMLAKLGYTAFALDMYGTGKLAAHPDDAKKFMEATLSDMKVAETRFNEAKRLFMKHTLVEPNKIAAIGYCFGGGTVLHMARIGTDLAGVVSFHGSLSTEQKAKPGQIKAKLLVFNGAEDPFVTREQITEFKQEMKSAGADLDFVDYPGVKHSFTNPDADDYGRRFNMPLVFNAQADKDSWERMQQFLKQVFK